MFKLAFLDGSHHHNQLEGAGVLSQTVLTCNFQLPQNRYHKSYELFLHNHSRVCIHRTRAVFTHLLLPQAMDLSVSPCRSKLSSAVQRALLIITWGAIYHFIKNHLSVLEAVVETVDFLHFGTVIISHQKESTERTYFSCRERKLNSFPPLHWEYNRGILWGVAGLKELRKYTNIKTGKCASWFSPIKHMQR